MVFQNRINQLDFITPLLSKEGEQPENLKFKIMKNEFSKPVVSLIQIKNEYQNAEEFMTDFVSDEEVASELGPDYDIPCSELAYKADIRNAKDRILERRKKVFIQYILNIFCIYKFYLT